MATRQKKTLIQGITAEQANDAFANYAKADAQINKINADIELQCAKIREKRADELTRLSDEREKAFDTLQAYAVENQAELFTKKKSLEMTHGTIGFRTGTPKLKTLKGFTWASALQLVKEFLPGYVRQTEEIAKDKLLADRDSDVMVAGDPLGPGKPMREQMAKCGIAVTQDETFYVEPKKEEAN
jgi:phage host-nuclease inhibitor protein Gam